MFENPQMWVWPQVPLGGTSPSTPCALGRLPHANPGRLLPGHGQKARERGGEEREGEGGEGRAVA